LASFPLNAIHIQGTVLAEQPWDNAVKGVRNIGHQHCIHVAPQHVNHACQRVCKSPKIFGFNTRCVDQPDTVVNGWLLFEESLAAINNYVMPAFHQTGGELYEKCLCPTISGRDPPAAEDRDPQLSAINQVLFFLLSHKKITCQAPAHNNENP